jgi:peptide/nickel transport system substrate-binding protein
MVPPSGVTLDTYLGEEMQRRSLNVWLAILLSFVMLAAACGDDGDADSPSDGAETPDESEGTDDGGETSADDATTPEDDEQLTSEGEGGGDADVELEPQYGGTLKWALNRDGTGFATNAAVAPGSARIINAMTDPLVRVTNGGEWAPNLAESLTPNDDFTVWTIALRPGITFHDGAPVDAAAVAANLNAFKAGPVTGFAFGPLTEATAVDELTVEVTMNQSWAAFPFTISGQPGWMVSPDTIGTGDTMVSTGPFILENWTAGQGASLVRNPDYWQEGLPYLDAIEFTFVPEQSVRRLAFEGNDVDGYISPGDADILDYLEDDEIDVWIGEAPGNEMLYLLNTSVEPFSDVRVRQALAYAVDRQVVIDTFRSGLTTPADGPIAENSPWYAESDYPDYDPEMAAALIAEVEAETGPISFEVSSEAGASFIEVTELVIDFWTEAGVDVTIKDVALGQSANTAISGEFQAFAWIQFSATDPDGDYVFFHSSGGPLNWSRLQNDKIDEGLTIGRTSDDPAERLRGYTLFQEGLAESVPMVWIDHFAGIEAQVARPYVHGIEQELLPDGREAHNMTAGSFMPWGDIWMEPQG